jgi:hypothetical protein
MLLLGAAPATAAPTWLTPASPPSWLGSLELSPSTPSAQNAFDPDVAVAPSGDATVVWHRFDGVRTRAQWTARRAGGSFAPAQALSPSGEAALDPRVGVDREGAATTVWRGSAGGSRSLVRAATRPAAGGGFGAPATLSVDGQDAREPDLAVAPDGAAVAVWSRFDGTRHVIEAATRPAGGVFGPAERVSEAGQNAEAPRVEMDAEGRALVAWSRRGSGGDWVVEARGRSTAGGFGGVETLSAPGADAGEVDVAMAGDGTAAVAWTRASRVQAATRSATGSFGAPADLSAAPGPLGARYRDPSARDPRVAIGAGGAATAVWTRFDGDVAVVQASTRSSGAGWSSPSTISAAGVEAEQPQVAADGRGDATATWVRVQGIDRTVLAARRISGGSFGASTAISASGQGGHFPRLAFDAEGNATAAWFHTTTSIGQAVNVQGAGFDAAGPELRDLRVPPVTSAGASTSFSVSPFDVWSPAAASGTSWDFGDGSSSTGTAVSHTYAAAGTYTVRVSSTDAVGNVTSTTRPIEVAPASTPGTGSGAGEPPPPSETTTTTPAPPPPTTTTTTTPAPPPTTTTTTTPAPPPTTTTTPAPPPTTTTPAPPPTTTKSTTPAPPPPTTTTPPPPPQSTTTAAPPPPPAPAPSTDGGSAGSSDGGSPPPASAPLLTPPAPTPGPRAAPNVSVSVPAATRRIRAVLARGLRVRVVCSEACTVSSKLVLTRGRVVAGRGSRRLAPRQSTEVVLRLTRRGRATLRRARRVTAELRTGVADGTGNATPTATRFVLRR